MTDLKAEIKMQLKLLSENKIGIFFDYSPQIVSVIKKIPGRAFDPKLHCWTVENDGLLKKNLQALSGLGFDLTDVSTKLNAPRLEPFLKPQSPIFDRLYPFQRELAEYMVNYPGTLNGSDVGTGKTIVCLAVSRLVNAQKTLVVVPKTIVGQWEEKCAEFVPEIKVFSSVGNKKERAAAYARSASFPGPQIFITTYEHVRMDWDEFVKIKYDCLFCDEIHRIKNYVSLTSKAVSLLNATRRYGASATPIMSYVQDAFGIYKFLRPGMLGSFKLFTERYIEKNYFGGVKFYKKLPELKERISPWYVSKTLEEVGYQLPPTVDEDITFDLSKKEYDILNKMKSELIFQFGEMDVNKLSSPMILQNQLTKLGKLSEAADSLELVGDHTDSTKLDILKDHLQDTILNGNKAVVFSRFSRMVSIMERELAAYNPAIITGSVKDRDAEIDKFNKNESCKLMLITTAGSEGLNLERANFLYFYDLPWSYGRYYQTCGRIRRIGQTKPTIVFHLLGNKTVDLQVRKKLKSKKEISDQIFRNMDDIKEALQ